VFILVDLVTKMLASYRNYSCFITISCIKRDKLPLICSSRITLQLNIKGGAYTSIPNSAILNLDLHSLQATEILILLKPFVVAYFDAACSVKFYAVVVNKAPKLYFLKTFCSTAERYFSILVEIW